MIEIKRYNELSVQTRDKLRSYINAEFGHIPIVSETEWAIPDWTIIYFEYDQIVTFCNIVEREITIDNKNFKIGGINNLITPKEFRGKGFAKKTLHETENFLFNQLKCELGMLLCADDLIPFYERLSWFKLDCSVYFNQSSGEKLWGANTMLLSKTDKMSPRIIKLNGLPW